MFWMTIYFFVTFSCVLAAISSFVFLFRRLRIKIVWQFLCYAALLFLPFVPYAVVAAQTAMYRVEMLPDVRASSIYWGSPGEKYFVFRILNITPSRAKVYVVTSCEGGMGTDRENDKVGMLITLKHTSKGWKFANYDAAWSDCGSAEGNTFPPYPEAREF